MLWRSIKKPTSLTDYLCNWKSKIISTAKKVSENGAVAVWPGRVGRGCGFSRWRSPLGSEHWFGEKDSATSAPFPLPTGSFHPLKYPVKTPWWNYKSNKTLLSPWVFFHRWLCGPRVLPLGSLGCSSWACSLILRQHLSGRCAASILPGLGISPQPSWLRSLSSIWLSWGCLCLVSGTPHSLGFLSVFLLMGPPRSFVDPLTLWDL